MERRRSLPHAFLVLTDLLTIFISDDRSRASPHDPPVHQRCWREQAHIVQQRHGLRSVHALTGYIHHRNRPGRPHVHPGVTVHQSVECFD